MALRLCVIVRVHEVKLTAKGYEPVRAEIPKGQEHLHLHEDGETRTHTELSRGQMRVCVPLTMEQGTLDLGI